MLSRPQYALTAAFLFRAALKMKEQPDTRVSIGIGPVDDVPDRKLSEATGEAFQLSGKRLDSMKKNMQLFWDVPQLHELSSFEALLNVAVHLASRFIDRWSKNDARAFWGAVQGMTQKEIGQLWPASIKQQSVQDALSRAGWPEIKALNDALASFF